MNPLLSSKPLAKFPQRPINMRMNPVWFQDFNVSRWMQNSGRIHKRSLVWALWPRYIQYLVTMDLRTTLLSNIVASMQCNGQDMSCVYSTLRSGIPVRREPSQILLMLPDLVIQDAEILVRQFSMCCDIKKKINDKHDRLLNRSGAHQELSRDKYPEKS